MLRNAASFRDPSGQVYETETWVYRTITAAYAEEWVFLKSCGLLETARNIGLGSFEEVSPEELPTGLPADAIHVLRSPRLPFISCPYEWCFSQLKAAALLTLDLHLLALEHGCILKDASAYNVQFFEAKPLFIDLLSFERWSEGQPWQAYGQFCRHFLAPLALMCRRDCRCGLLSSRWIDGIPLDLANSLLPASSWLSLGLAMHIRLHDSMQRKHGDGRQAAAKVRQMRMSLQKMKDVAQSLKETVLSLKLPTQNTEWGDYYNDTNYTPTARIAKEEAVSRLVAEHPGRLALDLGANTGEFSRLLAPYFALVLSTDYDHTAVEKQWLSPPPKNVLPLVLDLANPSPSIGWACGERLSIIERCKADMVIALALCHHLRFTFGIPFTQMAECFRSLLQKGGYLMVEFVPREDSQVQRLLAGRDDVFDDYEEGEFLAAFCKYGLQLVESIPIEESVRTIHLFACAPI